LLDHGEGKTRIAVKVDGRVLLLRAAEIDWVAAAGVYVELHVGKKLYLHRASLSELEQQLGPERFVRIHRSRLVNIDRIRELAPRAHGDFSVLLRDGTELGLSRSYREQLGAALGQTL
jgi:two-component system LytT family response regulator